MTCCFPTEHEVALLTPTGETEIGDAMGTMERVEVQWYCLEHKRLETGELWRAKWTTSRVDDLALRDLAAIRSQVQTLRMLHHALRHAYIAGCAECLLLGWLEEMGW